MSTTTINSAAHSYIRSNPDLFAAVYQPEPFHLVDLPVDLRTASAHIKRMQQVGIVRRVGRDPHHSEQWGKGTSYRSEWAFTDKGEAVIQEMLEDRDTLPCGHGGVENLGGGEYRCGYDDCDAVHDRATVAAYLGVRE